MGKLIRQARQEANLTQTELSELVYLQRPSLSDMENGEVIPAAATPSFLVVALNNPPICFGQLEKYPFDNRKGTHLGYLMADIARFESEIDTRMTATLGHHRSI
jgi:transcriptional regulator with XRE-family HTH domain